MRRLIAAAVVVFVLSHGFDSLIRWVLELVKLGPLIYARDAVALGAILLGAVDLVRRNADARTLLGAGAALVGATAVAFGSALPVEQVGFGIKVWLPMFLGIVAVTSGAIHDLDQPRRWLWVWGLLVAGVLANLGVSFPWEGMVIQVGDTAVSGNRAWSTGGIARVSGFSRTSFDAAMCIVLLAFYLVQSLPRRSWCVALWLVSGVAIAVTTTKATIGVFIAATPLLPVVGSTVPGRPRLNAPRRMLASLAVTSVATIGLVAPVATASMDLPLLETGSLEHLLFASLVDRAWSTWPQAWALLDSWQLVLGRGVGGIGAAQSYYELARSSPADNLFVYAYVTGGVFAALIYVYVAQLCWRMSLTSRSSRICYFIILFLFVDGLTTNVVECASALIAVGAACTAAIAELSRARGAHA
jgi:hypothetical protein